MTLAHFGLAVSVAGIAASAFEVERIADRAAGRRPAIAGYVLHLDGVDKVPGPNFTADARRQSKCAATA